MLAVVSLQLLYQIWERSSYEDLYYLFLFGSDVRIFVLGQINILDR